VDEMKAKISIRGEDLNQFQAAYYEWMFVERELRYFPNKPASMDISIKKTIQFGRVCSSVPIDFLNYLKEKCLPYKLLETQIAT